MLKLGYYLSPSIHAQGFPDGVHDVEVPFHLQVFVRNEDQRAVRLDVEKHFSQKKNWEVMSSGRKVKRKWPETIFVYFYEVAW